MGHINLLPKNSARDLMSLRLLLRRDKANALGLPLLSALSLHWNFLKMIRTLKKQSSFQVSALLDRLLETRSASAPDALGEARRCNRGKILVVTTS